VLYRVHFAATPDEPIPPIDQLASIEADSPEPSRGTARGIRPSAAESAARVGQGYSERASERRTQAGPAAAADAGAGDTRRFVATTGRAGGALAGRAVRHLSLGLERRQPQGFPVDPLVSRAEMLAVLAIALGFPVVLLDNLRPIRHGDGRRAARPVALDREGEQHPAVVAAP